MEDSSADEDGRTTAASCQDDAEIPYEQLVENAHEGIAIIQDERFAELVGESPADLEGEEYLRLVDAAERATVADRYQKRLTGGDPPKQYRIRLDEDLVVETTGTRIQYDGRPAIKAVLRDVTDHHRYEEALSGLNEVARGFPRAETKAEIATLAVETGTAMLGIATLQVYLLNEDRGALEPVATDGDAVVDAPAVTPADTPVWSAFASGETVWLDDEGESGLVAETDDCRTAIVAPLGNHGVLVAGDVDGSPDGEQAELVETLAATTAAALDRAEREAALRRRDRELTTTRDRLDRVERLTSLFRHIVRAAFGGSTRTATAQDICDVVDAYGPCEFAWLGHPDHQSSVLVPQAMGGDDRGYLTATVIDTEASEPTATAYRTGDLQVVTETLDTQATDDWQQNAAQRGFRTVIGVPLVYEGVRYGVLGLYNSRQGELGSLERDLLCEAGRIVAASLSAVNRGAALLAQYDRELDIELSDLDCFLYRFARDADCSVSFDGVVPETAGENRVFVTVPGDDTVGRFRERARQSSLVTDLTHHGDGDDGTQFSLRLSQPFVGTVLASHGLTIRGLEASGRTATLTVGVPTTIETQRALAIVGDRYPSATLAAKRTIADGQANDRPVQRVFESLTARQREVLQRAHEAGYFDTPKGKSGSEIAEALGISSSTFHGHLTHAQRAVYTALFDDGAE